MENKLLTWYLADNAHMSSGPEFGLAAMYRVMKKSGAERVSDDSADELRKVLEEVAERIAKQAVELSLHAGRKTIKPEDVRLAAKNVIRL
jgi:DNA-binding protein